jgi:hypothetical protein
LLGTTEEETGAAVGDVLLEEVGAAVGEATGEGAVLVGPGGTVDGEAWPQHAGSNVAVKVLHTTVFFR